MNRHTMAAVGLVVTMVIGALVIRSPAMSVSSGVCTGAADDYSVARLWNEAILDAIRRDEPAPTVHARNLFHLSAAMYDAWAIFDGTASSVYSDEAIDASVQAPHVAAARVDAVSHAAAFVLSHRYRHAVGATESAVAFDRLMVSLCGNTVAGALAAAADGSAARLGADIGQAVLEATFDDGSLERTWYEDLGYWPVNPPLNVDEPGTDLIDPNRWQPLDLEVAIAQNGLPLEAGAQVFIGSQWGHVDGFALPHDDSGLPLDPGPPPLLGHAPTDAEYRAGVVEVIEASADLAPGEATIDLSPARHGNAPLGGVTGSGHGENPLTGAPYPPNPVDRGDYLRVIAEFWADGPDSETPPGHWNTIANHVSDRLDAAQRRVGAVGPPVGRLEWDIKLYLALNGALHDAAVAGWGAKAHYDYIRPISMIRYMGGLGQASDPANESYHPHGLPLIDGLIELITDHSSAAHARHEHLAEHVGEIAVRAWRGNPDEPEHELSGVGWIRAVEWVPYQRPTFVTPAFAAYVSGHSTFSRAAADLLTAFTGSPYFPGGVFEHTVEAGALLHEEGPTETVILQWASYGDAADEAGRSRIFGGIHVSADDIAGRLMGAQCAELAWARAQLLFG